MSLSEAQNTVATMFIMLGMTDVKHFMTPGEVRYVTGTLRGKKYIFSHKFYKEGNAMGYILSVNDDVRISTFDPNVIASAVKLLLRDNNAVIPRSIVSEPIGDNKSQG